MTKKMNLYGRFAALLLMAMSITGCRVVEPKGARSTSDTFVLNASQSKWDKAHDLIEPRNGKRFTEGDLSSLFQALESSKGKITSYKVIGISSQINNKGNFWLFNYQLICQKGNAGIQTTIVESGGSFKVKSFHIDMSQ